MKKLNSFKFLIQNSLHKLQHLVRFKDNLVHQKNNSHLLIVKIIFKFKEILLVNKMEMKNKIKALLLIIIFNN